MGWFAGKYMAVNAKPDVLSEIILEMGSTDKKTLATGESWDIGNSYTLIAKQIDLDGDKVWLALEKTGVEVESSIIDIGQNPCGDTFVNLHEYSMATTDTFVYQPDIGSESDVPIFTVAVTAIFRGTDVNLVQLKYAMLIDSELLTIGSDYESHEMMVTSITATSVTLQNGHSMTLTQDSDIDIMGDIIFRVADDCDGDATTEYRFYPMVERTICGVDPTPDPMPTVTATAEPISISTVTIADVTMQLGATTDVPIRLLNSTGVGGVTATLTFDPSIVDVTSVVAGDFDSVFSPDYSGVSSGILRITCTKIGTDMTGDLTIATVTLAAVATSGSCELGLSAELSTASGVAVPSSTDNGTLTISGRTPGDVTGDGVVNIGDAVLLFNWVSFPNERGTTYVLQ